MDPGACSLKLYEPLEQKVFSIRSVMAADHGEQYLGEEAFELFWDKGSGVIRHPVDQGILSGDITPLFLKLVSKCAMDRHIFKPSLRVLLSPDAESQQKDKWIRMAEKAGFRKVFFSDPASELKVDTGLVIHAGCSCTVISIWRGGRLLAEKKIIFAGRQIDEAIMDYVAKKYRSLMFYEDAAALKVAASNAFFQQKNPVLSCTVLNRHNQYERISVKASELWPAMSQVLEQIVIWTRELVSQLELSNVAAVLQQPVHLSGGLAACYGLRQMLAEQLNAEVIVPEEPENELVKKARLKSWSNG